MQVQGEYKHTELDRSGSLFQLLMNSILTTRALTITHWWHQRPSRGTWHSKVTFSAKWNQDWFTNKTMTYAACGPSACMGLRPWSSDRTTSDRQASNEQATHGPRARLWLQDIQTCTWDARICRWVTEISEWHWRTQHRRQVIAWTLCVKSNVLKSFWASWSKHASAI